MNEMLEAGRFATTGRLDEMFFRQNMKRLLSRRAVAQLWLQRAAGLIAFGALYVWLNAPVYLVLGVVWLALSFILQGMRLRKMERLQVQRMKEIVPEGVMMMTTSFHEDGVHSRNETTGGSAVLPYEHIACLKETEEHLLLISRARQYEVVFKQNLEGKDVAQLKDFLRGKCPGLKIK